MNGFSGFPAKAKFTPIPNLFFSDVVPRIDDIAELKVSLHIFWAMYMKRGYPRFVTHRELLGDPVLVRGLGANGAAPELLQRGLELATRRGTLIRLTVKRDGTDDDLYFVNTEADRRAVERVEKGEVDLGVVVRSEPLPVGPEQPNIFTLYEQNIGMLSPLIAEELRDAEKLYPDSWIHDAFREAVDLNKRSWRYIARILERWSVEGKDNGEPERHSKAESDPKEFYRRYGHLLKR